MQVIDSGKGKTIEAFGLQTNYLEMGEGEPLLLLHGSGPGVSAHTNWRKIIPELAKHFRVIAPDLAGFGHTERDPNFSYDIKHWGKHLLAFLDALGIEKTHVIGNSFGGSLTLATAARFPERFSKLCLMGTPCDKFFMTPGLRSGWDYTPSRENMRQAMSNFPHNPDTITDELVEERYQTSLIPGAQEGLRKLLVQPNEEGETQLSGMPEHVVAKINHPAIVIHGREDKVVPTEMGFKLGRSMPNADLHVLANCGHWVMAERPKEFLQTPVIQSSEYQKYPGTWLNAKSWEDEPTMVKASPTMNGKSYNRATDPQAVNDYWGNPGADMTDEEKKSWIGDHEYYDENKHCIVNEK